MSIKNLPRIRPNRKTKYKYKDPNRIRSGQKLPHCFLCKKWLKPERYSVGVCPECESLVDDPMYVKYARDYFNDPEYYQRVLTTLDILKETRG